jgi:hypothetical protein
MESRAGNAGEYDLFGGGGARVLRFRAQPEGGSKPSRRRYQAAYSHANGSSRFKIDVDLVHNELTFHRGSGDDYRAMLLDLAGHPPGLSRIPSPRSRLDSLSFDIEVIGLKLPAVQPALEANRAGGWLVVRAFVPSATDSFLLGTNEGQAAGEIVIARPKSTRAVVLTLAKVFG